MNRIRIGALTRICENTTGYVRPDGKTIGQYSAKTGFNQEDWLDRGRPGNPDATDFTDASNPLFVKDGPQMYSHLAGLRKAAGEGYLIFDENSPYGHLGLITKSNQMIGYFKKVIRLTEQLSSQAYARLDSNGIGRIREAEAGGNADAWSANKSSPLNCLNIRYTPEDLVLFDEPIILTSSSKLGNISVTDGSDNFEIPQEVINRTIRSRRQQLFWPI